VANVVGLNLVKSGEMVLIGHYNIKSKLSNGMVLSLNTHYVSVALFDKAITVIKCGQKVVRTRLLTSIPLSLNLFGRTVDSLAAPLDGKGRIISFFLKKIDTKAIGIIRVGYDLGRS
jgi:F-type H+-transporting ATPase subunit alpha